MNIGCPGIPGVTYEWLLYGQQLKKGEVEMIILLLLLLMWITTCWPDSFAFSKLISVAQVSPVQSINNDYMVKFRTFISVACVPQCNQ